MQAPILSRAPTSKDARPLSPEEFREFGHRLIDWIADYRAIVGRRPVMARTDGEVKSQFPASPPEMPEDFGEVFGDLERVVLPGLSHWQHPDSSATSPPTPARQRPGRLVSTGLGVLGLSWQSSPALTELEEVVTDWVRRMVGLSAAWSGVIQDTASTSALVALICARERTTGYGLARGGLQGAAQPRVYTSGRPQLGRQGGAAGGIRPGQRAPRPDDEGYAMRPDASPKRSPRRRRRRAALRRRGDHGHDDPTAIDPVGIARWPRPRPVAPRRCRHGGLGDDPARMPLDVGGVEGADSSWSTPTSGSGRPSTARSTTSGTPSTSSG